MALGPRLDLRQSQTLVMTPQLQQAIRLLQMSNVELAEYVEKEIEQNPLLERESDEGGMEDGSDASETSDAAADRDDSADYDAPAEYETDDFSGSDYTTETDNTDFDGTGFDGIDDSRLAEPDAVALSDRDEIAPSDSASVDARQDEIWDNQSASDGAEGPGGGATQWNSQGGGYDGADPDLENVGTDDVTLRDHLMGQINVDLEDPQDRMIASQLIEQLDDAGYFAGSIEPVAVAMGCEIDRVRTTLDRLKTFDPPGIFAESLSECLSIQLRELDRLDPAMQALMDNLELLGKRDFTALRRECGVDTEDLIDMVNEIKALNPKPASAFDNDVAQPVTPDVLVRPRADGGWDVELNSDNLPRVLVNSRYYAKISGHARSKADKEYLIDCYQTANWLVKALQQRAETILKVASELVIRQHAFFAIGVEHLKPLTLRELADAIGVHESTVSRVTNNKYVGFSRGVYELKYFFSSAVGQSDAGDQHSAEAIRVRIRALIDDETPDTVLSDDKIVDILRRDGVDIARRTVAKYRESMRIPSSVQRRREKALHV